MQALVTQRRTPDILPSLSEELAGANDSAAVAPSGSGAPSSTETHWCIVENRAAYGRLLRLIFTTSDALIAEANTEGEARVA